MANETENPFPDLYEYASQTGIVIPQTSYIKQLIVDAFGRIFGADVSTSDETPMGRFIEALTMLFVNVLGVNAQNANFLNPQIALGNALDNLGAIFGINRLLGEGDESLRARILAGQSRGRGFAESIVQAISSVSGVTSAVVLNNGNADPAIRPVNEAWSIQVAPHSVCVCVRGGADADIAEAITKTISLGCGMVTDDPNAGAETSVDDITFYRPSNEITSSLSFAVSISPNGYDGEDISADAEAALRSILSEYNRPCTIVASEIQKRLTDSGIGVVCTDASITRGGVISSSTVIYPKDEFDADSVSISVDV